MKILVIGSCGEEKISRSQLKEIAAGFGKRFTLTMYPVLSTIVLRMESRC